MGYILSAVAGAAMSIQGVMNTRLSEKTGVFEANVIVSGIAFILSIAAVIIAGKGSFRAIGEVNKLYLLGGVLGIVITVTVMLGMEKLTPALAVSVILISQLFVAALINALGIMGTEKEAFGWTKYAGLALMIGGVILFKR